MPRPLQSESQSPSLGSFVRSACALRSAAAGALSVGALLWAPAAWAQPVPPAETVPAQTLLTGQIDLARLLDLTAKRLRLNVQYDPAAVKGSVTLRLEGPVTDAELWALTNRALAAGGFTTVRVLGSSNSSGNGAYQVVKLQDAAGQATIQPRGPLSSDPTQAATAATSPTHPPPPGFQIAVFQIRHRPAKEIVEALKLINSKTGGSVAEITGSAGGAGLPAAPSATGGSPAPAISAPGTGGLIVVADLEARLQEAQRLITMLDVPGVTSDQRATTRFIPVQHLAPAALIALVQQVSAKRELVSGEKIPGELVALPSGTGRLSPPESGAAVTPDPAPPPPSTTGGLLLIAPPSHLAYWTGLIDQLDQRESMETRAYTPRHFPVKEVARLVEQTASDAADERWRLVTDDLTGTFMVTATPSQHARIDQIMDRLDSVPASARRPVRSFKVRNRGVNELLAVLNELVRSGALQSVSGDDLAPAEAQGPSSPLQSPASSIGNPTPPSPSPPTSPWPPASSPITAKAPAPAPTASNRVAPGSTSRVTGNGADDTDITLTADEATSTIIAIGEPRLLAQLEALIRSLDVRQPQVMLEVLLISLSDTQALSLGTELEKIEIRGDTAIRLSSLFGLSSSDSLSASGGNRTAADRPGFTGLVLNPGEFAVVVRAMESLNKGRSLTIPKVLVGNNQQATFNSTLQQPFATTTISSTTGDVSSQSFGGTQDAGTKVAIKPQIAEGDHLVLGYNIELSSFVGSSSGGLPPPKQQNSIQSSVSVPDGFTVVVGGLEITSDSKSTTQVPFIGSLPLIGELFKNRTNDNNRSRFFVFIRANVLRQERFEDLKYLSAAASGAAKVNDGFPAVEPQVIK